MTRSLELPLVKTWMVGSSPAKTMSGAACAHAEHASLSVMAGLDPAIHVSAVD
jgi:hypothetical protein